jgi:hypothetical protein
LNKNRIFAFVLSLALCCGGIALAQRPERDINPNRYPNLAAAQQLMTQAWGRISDAQRANEFDMNGHAQKAKDLLDAASRELKLAADDANHHRH